MKWENRDEQSILIMLSAATKKLWQDFQGSKENKGHAFRNQTRTDFESYLHLCLESSSGVMSKITEDLKLPVNARILEIGCSFGPNCFSLAKLFPNSAIIGIEPESKAVQMAQSIQSDLKINNIQFIHGFGEKLPIEDRSIDFIVCNTVIEHVQNVELVISEIARVLRPEGIAHIEAPNYLWPYEPHLKIITIPKLGKSFTKALAIVQNKKDQVSFLDHLNFITPFELESYFKSYDLNFRNLFFEKMRSVTNSPHQVKKYKALASLLAWATKLRLDRVVHFMVERSGVYPSVIYRLQRHQSLQLSQSADKETRSLKHALN